MYKPKEDCPGGLTRTNTFFSFPQSLFYIEAETWYLLSSLNEYGTCSLDDNAVRPTLQQYHMQTDGLHDS